MTEYRPPRRANWFQIGSLLGLLMLGSWLMSLIGVIFWERRDMARPAAAIVVLGAAQYVGHPSPVLRARLDHAIDLWRRGFAPRIIFTGGFGVRDTTSEAAVSKRYAIEHGIPSSAILIESSGTSTSESLRRVSTLMDSAPSRDVILVSDPFHSLRVSIIARRFDLVPFTSPTRSSPISQNRKERWKYTLAESMKVPIAFLLERRP
jgi:uncharacterized SAM-binding protein YcdF (DUF218 family)